MLAFIGREGAALQDFGQAAFGVLCAVPVAPLQEDVEAGITGFQLQGEVAMQGLWGDLIDVYKMMRGVYGE